MTRELYNLHTDGDQWRITKFVDGNVESSYLCTYEECDCPAGHRHTCRHREMIGTMIADGLCDSHWFWDRINGQVVDLSGIPKRYYDSLVNPAMIPAPPAADPLDAILDGQPVPEGLRVATLDETDTRNTNDARDWKPYGVSPLAPPTPAKPWRRM